MAGQNKKMMLDVTTGINDVLPLELILKIFSYLRFGDLIHVSEVCRLWSTLADDPFLYREIVLTSEDEIETEKVLSALRGKTQVYRLDLHSRTDSLEIFDYAARNCPNLKQLSITASTVPREVVDTLVDFCTTLECLNFGDSFFSEWDTPDSFRLSKLKQLRVLDLSRTFGFPICGLSKIAMDCHQLSEFSMDRVSNVPDDIILCLAIHRRETLRKLRFDGENMTRENFAHMCCFCQKLQIMGIEVASTMKDTELMSLSLQDLVWLRLKSLATSGPALDAMLDQCNLTNLRYLDLSDCLPVHNFTMKQIAKKCHSLVCLKLKGCDNVTGHGVAQLTEGCKLLQFLNLEGMTRINGGCFREFPSKMSKLKLLNLTRCTDVSVESVSELQEKMPLLSILYLGHKQSSPGSKSRLVEANNLLRIEESLSFVMAPRLHY